MSKLPLHSMFHTDGRLAVLVGDEPATKKELPQDATSFTATEGHTSHQASPLGYCQVMVPTQNHSPTALNSQPHTAIGRTPFLE